MSSVRRRGRLYAKRQAWLQCLRGALVLGTSIAFAVVLAEKARCGEVDKRGGVAVARDDLLCIELSDGSTLHLSIGPVPSGKRDGLGVLISRKPKGGRHEKRRIWAVAVTSMSFPASDARYYGLVKVTEKQVLVFATWDARWIRVSTDSGRVLESGHGDDVLKEFSEYVPLKLKIILPQTFQRMTEEEIQRFRAR